PLLRSPALELATVFDRRIERLQVGLTRDRKVGTALQNADERPIGAFTNAQDLLARVVNDTHLPGVVEPRTQVGGGEQSRRARTDYRDFAHISFHCWLRGR